MGGEYDRADNFVQKAKAALRKIRAVYPALKLNYLKGGFVLHPSLTAIAPAPTRQREESSSGLRLPKQLFVDGFE